MEIEIASPNEKEKMMMRQYQAQVAPLAQQQKGMAGQMGDMVKQKLMSDAAGAGAKAITAGAKQGMSSMLAPTVGSAIEGGAVLGPTAGAGGMAALGTAVPYVGAGLLAGKALGLFNRGGQIGPLSTQYHADGYQVPGSREYNIRMLRNKANRLEEPVMTSKDQTQSSKNFSEGLRQLRKQQDFVYPMIVSDYGAGLGTTSNMQSGVARMAFTDDPIAKKMYDVGNAPLDTSASGLTSNYIGYPIDDQGYTARGFEQGGQVGMTREQAMALMNNQPDPDQLYNEIVAESMTEAAQQQMPQPKMRPPLMVDPYGADTTYDAEMYKQINT